MEALADSAPMLAMPYSSGDGVTIWHGDARALPIPDESVHLIVTSPPYNARVNYDGYADWLPWDEYWHGLIEPSLRECFRVLVHGGRIAINIANVVRVDASEQVLLTSRLWQLLESIGFLPREYIVWSKSDDPADSRTSTAWGSWCSASNPVLRAVAEPVYIASKGSHRRGPGVSDITVAEFKAWTRNCWAITSGHADQYLPHPAMFPAELPRRIIKLYSYVGDVVLDPFMGSGTTLRVAKDLRRVALGVEQSERYCRLATARCAQSLLPLEAAHAAD